MKNGSASMSSGGGFGLTVLRRVGVLDVELVGIGVAIGAAVEVTIGAAAELAAGAAAELAVAVGISAGLGRDTSFAVAVALGGAVALTVALGASTLGCGCACLRTATKSPKELRASATPSTGPAQIGMLARSCAS